VSEVAYRVGFSDPKYFSTCFKKQFGISPTKV
jgi:AraC-like DNA-binding protein